MPSSDAPHRRPVGSSKLVPSARKAPPRRLTGNKPGPLDSAQHPGGWGVQPRAHSPNAEPPRVTRPRTGEVGTPIPLVFLPQLCLPPKKQTNTRGSEEGELSMLGCPHHTLTNAGPALTPCPSPAQRGRQVRGQEPNQLGLRRPVPKGVPRMCLGESSPWLVRVGATLLGAQPPYADPCPQSPAGYLLAPSPGQVLFLPPGVTPPPKCASVFPSRDGKKGFGDPSSSQSQAPARQSQVAFVFLLSWVTHLSTKWWLRRQPAPPTPPPPTPRHPSSPHLGLAWSHRFLGWVGQPEPRHLGRLTSLREVSGSYAWNPQLWRSAWVWPWGPGEGGDRPSSPACARGAGQSLVPTSWWVCLSEGRRA